MLVTIWLVAIGASRPAKEIDWNKSHICWNLSIRRRCKRVNSSNKRPAMASASNSVLLDLERYPSVKNCVLKEVETSKKKKPKKKTKQIWSFSPFRIFFSAPADSADTNRRRIPSICSQILSIGVLHTTFYYYQRSNRSINSLIPMNSSSARSQCCWISINRQLANDWVFFFFFLLG